MKAYYHDTLPTPKHLPHECTPNRPVSVDQLSKIGILYRQIPVDGESEGRIDEISRERVYKSRDSIDISREGLGDMFESKLKGFFEEHMHEDEEIRYVLAGGGFFDVREMPTDEWIRIAVSEGDLLVLPAGIYHRFTLDGGNRAKLQRLFKDIPKWEAHYRSEKTDENPYRREYVQSLKVGQVV